MSDTDERHGPALAAFLDALRGTQSMRAFAMQHQFDHNWPSQWRNGHREPQIDQMRALADALGLPLGEVLVAAEWGTPADFGGVRPMDVAPLDVDAAIEGDLSLTEEAKVALRAVRSATRNVKKVRTRATR